MLSGSMCCTRCEAMAELRRELSLGQELPREASR